MHLFSLWIFAWMAEHVAQSRLISFAGSKEQDEEEQSVFDGLISLISMMAISAPPAFTASRTKRERPREYQLRRHLVLRHPPST